MTNQELKDYAQGLGYTLDDADCQEIRDTSYTGETVSHAVKDFLNAYECAKDWGDEE